MQVISSNVISDCLVWQVSHLEKELAHEQQVGRDQASKSEIKFQLSNHGPAYQARLSVPLSLTSLYVVVDLARNRQKVEFPYACLACGAVPRQAAEAAKKEESLRAELRKTKQAKGKGLSPGAIMTRES